MSDIFAQAESGDIKALTELLELLYDQNSPELFKWAQKAVDTDPDNPVFLNYMGICYDENKSEETDAEYNRNMAKKCYKRGAELGCKSAAYNFAVMLMKEENPEAMLWAKKAYEMGKTEAASLIADLYQAGIGTEVDKKASFQWELKGAEAGDEYAQDGIARRYLEGNGCPMNLGEALDWFRTAAESGNSASAAELSKIYRSGQYLPVDMETSIHYALMAAKGENPEVSELFDIADRYRQGDGVEKNVEKALELYKIAADGGNVACMTNVGLFYSLEDSGIPRDIDKAIEYFEKAAERGSEKGLYNLEDLYKEKYPENYQEHYFTKLSIWARSNYPMIWTELGLAYCNGAGVACNLKKGIEYLKKAADFGDQRGSYILSEHYATQRNPEAEKYLKLSIRNGNAASKTTLGKLYIYDEKYADKKAEGIQLLKEAAEEINDQEAMIRLGECEDSEKWWKKAGELGNINAIYRLCRLYKEQGRYSEAAICAQKGMEQNDFGCIIEYTDMLHHGVIGTEEERKKSYLYLKKAADIGNVHCADLVALAYLYGQDGAPQDTAEAIRYFTFVLENADPRSDISHTKLNLGRAYSEEGSTQNFILAEKYYEEGIREYPDKTSSIYEDAIMKLSDVYRENGKESQAFEILERSVNEGHKRCNYYLAVCYIDGTGTAKDHRKAADLLQEAMNSTQLNDMQKQMAQEMRDDLLNGVYGTDGSMNGQVNGGNVYQSGNSVSYRPDNNGNQKSGGCYIATCVYGSYDYPSVWVLRRFRDYHLAKYKLGRLFIRGYYAVSPGLVKHFGSQKWFRMMWKGILNPFVESLKRKGYSDEKYED